ncbi:MAG: hypothetical protein ACOYEC_05870 [Christensenellales bacterium]
MSIKFNEIILLGEQNFRQNHKTEKTLFPRFMVKVKIAMFLYHTIF